MKKALKILVFCLLAAILSLSVVACAGTSGDVEKKGLILSKSSKDTNYKVAKFVDDGKSVSDGVLDIGALAEAQGKVVDSIKKNAFRGDDKIKKLIVPTTVTEIEEGAFAGMKALEEIVLPFIGANATGDAVYNETASAPDKAVDAKRSVGYVFGTSEYAEGKTEVLYYANDKSETYYLPVNLNKITVEPANDYTIPMYAFNGLAGVEVVLGDNVSKIGEYAFAGSSIESITIPAKVTSVEEGAFSDCGRLKTVEFAENSALTAIKAKAFYGTKVKSFVLPETVETIGEYAFASVTGDTSLTPTNESLIESVVLSKNLTEIGEGAFSNCKKLTTVDFSSVSAAKIALGNYGFAFCEKLDATALKDKCEFNANGNCFIGTLA